MLYTVGNGRMMAAILSEIMKSSCLQNTKQTKVTKKTKQNLIF